MGPKKILLAEDDDKKARQFSSSALRSKRFTEGDWRVIETGAPALATPSVTEPR